MGSPVTAAVGGHNTRDPNDNNNNNNNDISDNITYKSQMISYPQLHETIDNVTSPNSYTEFLKVLSKQCSGLKNVKTYTDKQIEKFYNTQQSADHIRIKINTECSNYTAQANEAMQNDIHRRRNKIYKNTKKKRKVFLKKKRIKRFINKAKIDSKLVQNRRKGPFVGVYITCGEFMSRFLNLKPNQHILVASLGLPPS